MKNFGLLGLLLSFIVSVLSASAEIIEEGNLEDRLEKLNKLTLAEAKTTLSETQKQLEALLNLFNKEMEFSFSSIKEPSFNDEPYEIYDAKTTAKKNATYLNNLAFVQDVNNYPDSEIRIRSIDSSLSLSDVFHNPSVVIKKIDYANNTQQQVEIPMEVIHRRFAAITNTSKYINQLLLNIFYTTYLEKEYFLTKNNPIVLKSGSIKLEDMKGNMARISFPEGINDSSVIEIDAIHKSGKSLNIKEQSSNKKPSQKEITYLRKTNKLLKEIINNIDVEIKSIEELKEAFRKKSKLLPTPPDSKDKPLEFITYHFSGDVKRIRLVIDLDKPTLIRKEILIKRHPKTEKKKLGYYISTDKETKKKGFIDKNGKWTIKPTFKNIHTLNNAYYNNYYYRAEHKGKPIHLHWLNTNKKMLVPVDYETYGEHHGDLTIIVSEFNADYRLHGLINHKTGEIVVPIKYNYLRFEKGIYTAEMKGSDKKVLYDANGKLIKNE